MRRRERKGGIRKKEQEEKIWNKIENKEMRRKRKDGKRKRGKEVKIWNKR
jgi:hypothetical protein